MMTTQTVTPRGSIHHDDHTKLSQEGEHLVTNYGTGNLPSDVTVVLIIIL